MQLLSPPSRSLLAASFAAMAVIACVLFVRQQVLTAEDRRIDQSSEALIRNVELLIGADLQHRLAALDRLAAHRDVASLSGQGARKDAVRRYLDGLPGFRSVGWADATLAVRWVLPEAGGGAMRDLAFERRPTERRAIAEAQRTERVVLGAPVELAGGGFGLIAYRAVSDGAGTEGLLFEVLRLDGWLEHVLARTGSMQHRMELRLDDRLVYRQGLDSEAVLASHAKARTFDTFGLSWEARASPHAGWVNETRSGAAAPILGIGVALAALTALAVYLVAVARRAAAQRDDTATRLETLVRDLPGMVFRSAVEPDWPCEYCSDGCLAITGHERARLESGEIRIGALIEPGDRRAVADVIADAVARRSDYEVEYRIVDRSGELRWLWERGRYVASAVDGAPRLQGFVLDITEKMTARLALEETRAFSDSVIDTAAEAVVLIDATGVIETFNGAAQKMFDYTQDEVLGRDVALLGPGSGRCACKRHVRHYLDTGEAPDAAGGFETRARRADGSLFPVHLAISEVATRTGLRFVGLIRDLSRQKAAEREASVQREQLAHVDRLNALGEMAGGIAHEINQPLTAISLYAQAGKRLLENDDAARLPEVFENLSRHAMRAGDVIERVQRHARKRESVREEQPVESVLDEAATLAEAEAGMRGFRIAKVFESGLPVVSVDRVQIQQVVLNLLRNAMDATPPPGDRALPNGSEEPAPIELRAHRLNATELEISVRDHGRGVDEDVADRLFQPFSTTREEGMGMGLSISRDIVVAHAGHFLYSNNVDAGATFSFTLPTIAPERTAGGTP